MIFYHIVETNTILQTIWQSCDESINIEEIKRKHETNLYNENKDKDEKYKAIYDVFFS